MDHQPKFFENLSGTGKAIGVLTSGGDAQGEPGGRMRRGGGRLGGASRGEFPLSGGRMEGRGGWGRLLRLGHGGGEAPRTASREPGGGVGVLRLLLLSRTKIV